MPIQAHDNVPKNGPPKQGAAATGGVGVVNTAASFTKVPPTKKKKIRIKKRCSANTLQRFAKLVSSRSQSRLVCSSTGSRQTPSNDFGYSFGPIRHTKCTKIYKYYRAFDGIKNPTQPPPHLSPNRRHARTRWPTTTKSSRGASLRKAVTPFRACLPPNACAGATSTRLKPTHDTKKYIHKNSAPHANLTENKNKKGREEKG